ncbi:MAG: malto-oligosyltrehalose synthase [Vicinamibacterales bacterium]
MSDTSGTLHVDLVAPQLAGALRVPVSTYRLQLSAGFTFDDARALVDHLEALGIGACYLSPCLTAKSGSPHGYDVVDHATINPELGGREGFEALARALAERDIGVLLDVVPNHMRLDPVENPYWRDLLENGPSAPSAGWFDVDWRPVTGALHDKVLLPILGDQYGVVLERGEIAVARRDAVLVIRYFEHQLPLNPRQVPLVFGPSLGALAEAGAAPDDVRELRSVLTAFGNLPAYTERDPARREERRRETAVSYGRFARLLERSPAIRAFVDRAIAVVNGRAGDPGSFDHLHELLERQPYRLAYWRTAFDEINYRRFFDINELGAVRMEDPRVFEEAHRLVMELVGARLVTGLRLDHPDGLADPEAYFERLQDAAWRAAAHAEFGSEPGEVVDGLAAWRRARRAEDPSHWSVRPLYVVAEKILSNNEGFPPGWAIHGGTGYRFLNQVNGLYLDRAGLHQVERLWSRLTGRTTPFEETAYECRRLIAQTAMASEMNVLALALERIAASDRRTRDFTLNSLRKVLREVVACFPVYRTYVTPRGVSDTDRVVVRQAVAEARRRSPVMERSIFDFVERVLSAGPAGGEAVLAFAMRVQQITGPIQAKGLEDTAFYRHAALLAANEVGSHPPHPCLTPDEFHEANLERLTHWPDTMLALATHDTKRSGDARARLAALTERSSEWRRQVAAWTRANQGRRVSTGDGQAPDRADEYHMYQALLAIWPPEPADAPIPTVAPEGLAARVAAYMVKAVREAKERSSWLRPDQAYEDAMTAFIHEILEGLGARRFLPRFVPFARAVARHGAMTSLAQVLLQAGSPGVPDVYQGAELWDLHLVDPDNRGPVDFARRQAAVSELLPWLARAASGTPGDPEVEALVGSLRDGWVDGRVKAWVLAAALRHRRAVPDVFLQGAYVPLAVDPPDTPAVAFARVHAGGIVVVAAPRLAGRLSRDGEWPVGDAWGQAGIVLPSSLPTGPWRDHLTGRIVEAVAGTDELGRLPLSTVFGLLPGAWLTPLQSSSQGS